MSLSWTTVQHSKDQTLQSPSLLTYTYESEAHGSVSTIDHILCPSHTLPSFPSSHVMEEEPSNNSDHLPVTCQIDVNLSLPPVHPRQLKPPTRPNWTKLTSHELKNAYTTPLEKSLSNFSAPDATDYLSNPQLIDKTLLEISSLMLSTANSNIPQKRFHSRQTPKWDDNLKHVQRAANGAYKTWRAAGRPRNPDHPLRSAYKEAKRKFRSQLRSHNKNLREQFFANLDLNITDSRKLFREIRNFNRHSAEPPQSISHNGTTYTKATTSLKAGPHTSNS